MKLIGNVRDSALEAALIQIHATACRKLEDAGLLYTDIAHLSVKLNDRMRSCGGKAHYVKNLIEINYRLLHDKLGEFESTYLHELAHLASYYKYGTEGRGHGGRWASVMNVLGLPAERCHSLDVSALQHKLVKRHVYVCVNANCSREEPYKLTTRRHNNVRRGRMSIACRDCSGRLQYDAEQSS